MTIEQYFPNIEGSPASPRRLGWCYAAVVVLGMCFQLAYFHADDTLDRDSVFYVRGVEVWYRTGDFRKLGPELIPVENTTAMKYYTAPFYLFVLKTLKTIFPGAEIETLARWWGILAGGAALCLSMLCAKTIFDDDAPALLSGLILAVHPAFADLAGRVLRDMTYLLLLISVLFLCLTARKRRSPIPAALGGWLCCAGVFCRIEFLALAAALAPVAVYDMLRFRRRAVIIWGVFAVSAAAGFVFWTLAMGIPWDFFSVYLRQFIA